MTHRESSSDRLEVETPGRDPGMTQLVFHSLLCGTTALIPVPFLDDWALRIVKRRMISETLRTGGHSPDPERVRRLVGSGLWVGPQGCLYQALFVAVILPVKILGYFLRGALRTVFFVLIFKQAADRASASFHEGYLFDYAIRRHVRSGRDLDSQLARVPVAIASVLRGLNTSPVWSVFAGILRVHRNLFLDAARLLTRFARLTRRGKKGDPATEADQHLREQRRMLDSVVNYVADLLGGQEGYLRDLERRFDFFFTQTVYGRTHAVVPRTEPPTSAESGP
jgi:hypothetical protein